MSNYVLPGTGAGGFTLPGTGGGGGKAPSKPSWLGGVLHDIAAPVEHVAKDVGETAIGIPLGFYGLTKTAIENPSQLPGIAKGMVKYYEDFYGHDVLHHIAQHPAAFALDFLTVADLGTTAAARLGDVANVARLSELSKPAELVTRSPKAGLTGTGETITRMTSHKPIVKARQLAQQKLSKAIDDAVNKARDTTGVGPLEARRYGKAIQKAKTQKALGEIQPLFSHVKAFGKLSKDERTALNARSLDIHPSYLKKLWEGTPAGEAITPTVHDLMVNPSEKMQTAEPLMREVSGGGAELLKQRGALSEESELDRPGRFKQMAADTLGEPVENIQLHGDPWYMPHTTEPVKGSGPLQAVGGGKAEPRRLGTTKQNMGELFTRGLLDLHSDVLGPEFARRVKWLKFWGIHQALKRGAIRMSYDQIMARGGKVPKGYDFLRTSVPMRESQVLARRISRLEKLQETAPSEKRAAALQRMYARHADLRLGEKPDPYIGFAKQKIPFSVRGEGDVPLREVIPNVDDLHDSAVSQGFTTRNMHEAYRDESQNFYLVPKSTAKSATGEFTRAGTFMHFFNRYPLRVWRSLLLGLRPAFLVNNVVGNSLMYAMKVGGKGAVRDLFAAIREGHGDTVARQLLRDKATPPEMRAELQRQLSPIREHFPEQSIHATFGFTQPPTEEGLRGYAQKGGRIFQKGTEALPHFTARVAEQAPREALVRNFIRNSPEFKKTWRQLPRDTRTFNDAARQLLEGKGGAEFQRRVSEQVDRSLGNYTILSPFERNVMRNTLPFYAWYRAITTTTLHLATDNPLRARVLFGLGQLGAENALNATLPTYLRGAIPLPGQGPGGEERLLSTQAINPYGSLGQLGEGVMSNIGALGLNPFIQGALDAYSKVQNAPGATNKNVSVSALLGTMLNSIGMNLPPMAQLFPAGPSKLYPTRGRGDLFAGVPGLGSREAALEAWLGVPIKEPNPSEAAARAAAGQ